MVIIKNDFERVTLGGLLHDIGKLLNRSNFYTKNATSGKHPFLSGYFVDFLIENKIIGDDKQLKEIVKKHHEGNINYFPEEINVNGIKDDENLKKLALIVARADNYSSSERYEDDYVYGTRYFKETPLDCLFEGISLGEKEEVKEKYEFRYKLNSFNYSDIFPQETEINLQNDLDKLIKNFLDEIKTIKTIDFNILFINMLDCIKKYCWCIPSDTQKKICDLSLYDHLKTTSAIASASYNYHLWKNGSLDKIKQISVKNGNKENHFLLIGGDISGIQKYLYSIETTDSIAKRLRSRSFFIKLLSDVSAYKIIENLGLTAANIIISSGGKFYILAQNTDETLKKLKKIKKEINETLYNEYLAQLYLNLEWIEMNGDELGLNFSYKYDELNDKLEDGKGKKFSEEILNTTILEKELYNKDIKVTLCKVCRKELIKDTEEQCSKCHKDLEFGTLLPKMSKLAFYNEKYLKVDETIVSLFDIKCKIYKKDEEIEGEPFIVHYYNKKESEKREYPLFQDFYGGYTPINSNGEVKTFEEIASESLSGNLGILKGDVDNLGLIFSIGLRREEVQINDNIMEVKVKDTTSISRISTLSRMLDSFFSFWLPKHLEENEKNSYYVVYAGGDDFMIVGSWEKLIFLSEKLNESFSKFTGENKNITLTCGIAITKPKDPIYFSSQWATEAEEKGKSSGKNGVVIFDKYIPWNDFKRVFMFAEFIDKNYSKKDENNKIYNQSFLYRLLNYTEMAEKYLATKDGKYLKYISDFTYDLGRNIVPKLKEKYKRMDGKKMGEKELEEKIRNEETIRKLSEYFSIETIFNNEKKYKKEFIEKYMRVVLNYVVRKNREVK